MARINSNISSLIAQRNLAQSNTDLATSLERLSTGLQINGGADNPAGLIISERLRSELNGLNQAVNNSERASSSWRVIRPTVAPTNDFSRLLMISAAASLPPGKLRRKSSGSSIRQTA